MFLATDERMTLKRFLFGLDRHAGCRGLVSWVLPVSEESEL